MRAGLTSRAVSLNGVEEWKRRAPRPHSFNAIDLPELWGGLSGCGPAFLRVQPAGKPAAGKIAGQDCPPHNLRKALPNRKTKWPRPPGYPIESPRGSA